jgi:hypothetical protein
MKNLDSRLCLPKETIRSKYSSVRDLKDSETGRSRFNTDEFEEDETHKLKTKVKFLEERVSELESTVRVLMKYKVKYEKMTEGSESPEKPPREVITNNINSNIYGKVYFNQYITNGKKYNNILFRDEISENFNNSEISLKDIKHRTKKVLDSYYLHIKK